MPMSDNEAEKLILVGFTNPYQIRYAQEDYGGSFYPDAKYGCSIPLYMLKRHENRLHTGEQLASTIAAQAAIPNSVGSLNPVFPKKKDATHD